QQWIEREEDHILVEEGRRVPVIAGGGDLVVEGRVPPRLKVREFARGYPPERLGSRRGNRPHQSDREDAQEENRQSRADERGRNRRAERGRWRRQKGAHDQRTP